MLAFLLLSVVSAHLCVLKPQQRGNVDISTPGTGACFQKVAPCGNQPIADPVVTFVGGQPNEILIQQNLNHYSIGSRGWIDVSLSELSNPTSDDQFELINTIPDYPAYHQWTQTNITLQIQLPNIECAHCVLQVRYVPRKPTEPVFHQCVDIAIRQSLSEEVVVKKFSTLDDTPIKTTATYPMIGLTEGDGVTTLHNFDPTTGRSQSIFQIPATVQANQPTSRSHVPMADLSYIANGVVAVNRDVGLVYYLRANTYGEYPLDLVTIDVNKQQLVNELKITGTDFPISGIHFNHADGSIVVFGLKNTSNSFNYVAGSVNPSTGVFTQVAATAGVGAYVDFTWSDYDSSAAKLYIFTRHEDQPTTLLAQLVTVDFNAKTTSIVDVDVTNYIFSTFAVDSRTPNTLIAFSPGPVDDNGDVLKPVWQVVNIATDTGKVTSIATAPTSANAFPIWWGGGVGCFSNDPNTPAQDTTLVHFLATSAQHFPHPTQLVALEYDLINKNFTLAQPTPPLPFFFNIVWA